MGGQFIAESFVTQFAIYGTLEIRAVFQFPAYARAESGAFPVRFRYSAVRNRTLKPWNLGLYASVYLLGIQLLGVFPRFGHRIATLFLSQTFFGWQPEVFMGT